MSTELVTELNHNKSDKQLANEESREQSFDLSFLLFRQIYEDCLHYHWINCYLL